MNVSVQFWKILQMLKVRVEGLLLTVVAVMVAATKMHVNANVQQQ